MENRCILGISANTRFIGLAIIKDSSLIDYAVKLNKEKWSETKGQKIITSLQTWYEHINIHNIILSKPYAHHQTKQMESLYKKIFQTLKKKNVEVRSYSVSEVLRGWKIKGKKKKTTLFEKIALQYPELHEIVEKDQLNTSVYYSKLFEAIAVATYYQVSLSR